MEIKNKKTGTKGIFYIEQDGSVAAEMVYTMPSDNTMIIEHTEVKEALEGQGIGLKLVKNAADFARQHHIKIIPLCPFTLSIFKKKPDEFADVWQK